MSDSECRERIAVLETNQREIMRDYHDHIAEERVVWKDHKISMSKIKESVQDMQEALAKMQGFWAGIVFVLGAFSAAIGVAANRLFSS